MKDASSTPEGFNSNYEERRQPMDPVNKRSVKSIVKPLQRGVTSHTRLVELSRTRVADISERDAPDNPV